MRIHFFLAVFLVLPAAASAQDVGDRTTSPQAMLSEIDRGSPEEEMARLAVAASAYPLGTLENPVRVGGPEGERAYLARLRCADGSPVTVGARSEAGVDAFGSVAGAYTVTCGQTRSRIVFDMYHEEHVETRAPAGFILAS